MTLPSCGVSELPSCISLQGGFLGLDAGRQEEDNGSR